MTEIERENWRRDSAWSALDDTFECLVRIRVRRAKAPGVVVENLTGDKYVPYAWRELK